jgi:hypothetical protein
MNRHSGTMKLVPTPSQHCLHILRSRIDGLIPGQAGLLTERGHRLDQLIDLRIREMLPISRLDIFKLVRGRARVPVLDRDLIRRPMDRDP